MKITKVLFPIAALAAGYLGMLAIEATASDDIINEQVDTRPTVTVDKVEPIDFTVQLTSYGEVTPLESTNVAAQVSGEVESWNPNFIAGGVVKRGDVLFTIEKDAYEAALLQAQANLSNAQAQLIQEQAQADVAAREAKTLPDSRVTDLYLRKPQVMSAEAAVKSAQAQLRLAQRDLDNTTVRAPYDALIVSRNIGKGDYVNTGTPAAVINNIETAEVVFPVAGFDNSFLPGDMTGKQAVISVEGRQSAERQAVIHRDLGVVDEATRMTHFVARLDDPYALHSDKPVIKFGSYATVTFNGRTLSDVFRLPQELVTNNKLWTLDEDNKLQSHQVTVVREEGGYFLIRGQFDPSKVVVTLPEYPRNGMAVKVIESNRDLMAQRQQDSL
ncbi:efflux RND transporter periplasmic adaptor subunit [Alteromonas sp. ASW11-19]|uniref:Efflux RND transporter periplasmic adaptor subunit n=1 Tax=Alteromonas salexigens TaxID=2982530 RepID=A0ABT2VTP6_9ALTE|nr:efflux RND transporter periplasmic adaptor subunit [Alteromonas salexigens]MCU7555239.1 efflux RND transporter periplasmic adaptor subunit [Alteromonas salexigens]